MKLKFFRTLIINSLVAAVVGALFVLGGCSDDDTTPPFVPTQTILEIVNADPELSDLAAYLVEFPDLTALLSGTTTYTLFAPNNTAFASLYATPGFPADPADISLDLIKGVIAYHVVASEILSTGLAPTGTGAGYATLYNNTNACTGALTNQVIKVNDDGSLLTGSTTTNIAIAEADKLATNGVVHVTASVLIPPSVGATLTPILGKLAATVLLGADFTHLAKAMTKADCGVAGVTPLSNILADPSGATYTAFLPPNDVFEGTAALGGITVTQLIAAYTAQQWRDIILNHVVSGTKAASTLTNGTALGTFQNPGTTLLTVADGTPGDPTTDPTKSPVGKYLTTSGGTTGLGGATSAPIYVTDVTASNGVAHVVGQILFPN
jgi:transforming growth factor-beta-induced protein